MMANASASLPSSFRRSVISWSSTERRGEILRTGYDTWHMAHGTWPWRWQRKPLLDGPFGFSLLVLSDPRPNVKRWAVRREGVGAGCWVLGAGRGTVVWVDPPRKPKRSLEVTPPAPNPNPRVKTKVKVTHDVCSLFITHVEDENVRRCCRHKVRHEEMAPGRDESKR